MFPEVLELAGEDRDGPTPGEVEVFRVLRDAVKPDSEYHAFYEPAMGRGARRKWPDFVLFGRHIGIFVIEVKDWRAGQIVKFDKQRVDFEEKGRFWRRRNPERQAKSYGDTIVSTLEEHRVLLTNPAGNGPTRLPVGRLVAFPYISHKEYVGLGLDQVLPLESVLLREELDPSSERYLGGKNTDLVALLAPLQKYDCPALTAYDVELICDVIWPVVTPKVPRRLGEGKDHFQEQVRYLDKHQARVARTLGRAHQIVKGPPGSGKTLVLTYRCKFLSQFDPDAKNILFVCYNIALASYIKRLVQEHGIRLGPGAVRVYHFFELCSAVLGEDVAYEGENAEYYEMVVNMCRERIVTHCAQIGPFDAVLVDEGQDFDANMFRVLRGLLRREGALVIAVDSEQNLYHKKTKLAQTWKSLGIDIQGHVVNLPRVYRSTREIVEFAHKLIGKKPPPSRSDGDEEQMSLLPGFGELHGDPPSLVECGDSDRLAEFLVQDIFRWVSTGEYRRSEIAVIYDDKQYGETEAPSGFAYGCRNYALRLKDRMEEAGIPVEWVSESVYSKKSFDITTDRVSLLSLHSAKGIDFDLVYLVEPGRGLSAKAIPQERLGSVYVATTRAKHRLQILCVEGDPFIGEMEQAGAQLSR